MPFVLSMLRAALPAVAACRMPSVDVHCPERAVHPSRHSPTEATTSFWLVHFACHIVCHPKSWIPKSTQIAIHRWHLHIAPFFRFRYNRVHMPTRPPLDLLHTLLETREHEFSTPQWVFGKGVCEIRPFSKTLIERFRTLLNAYKLVDCFYRFLASNEEDRKAYAQFVSI